MTNAGFLIPRRIFREQKNTDIYILVNNFILMHLAKYKTNIQATDF